MNTQNTTVIAVVMLYIAGLMYVGYRGFRRTRIFSDYILGGRKLGPVIGAMNVGASDMSSWLLMGLPAAFMLHGVNQTWMVLGLIAGSYTSWRLIAVRLRKYTEVANNSLTLSSFLENRFSDNSKILSIITSAIILFFFVIYIASGFVGSAKLFVQLFGIKYHTALACSCVIIVAYALLGGFFAVSFADMFQGMLMLFALLIVPCVLCYHIVYTLNINPLQFIAAHKPSHINFFYNVNIGSFLAIFSWGLGYFGQPHIISKYMAIKNVEDFKSARIICISWMAITMFSTALIGILGFVYFYEKPLLEPETIFIVLSSIFFHPIMVGVLISAVLAAIMSTINSQIIICCSALSEDLYKRFFRQKAQDFEMLLVTRCFVVLISLIASVIAIDTQSSVLSLVAQAWAGLGASIGPVIIFALFWQKTTKTGAIAGVISGGFGAYIFHYFNIAEYEILPAFMLSCLCIYIFSKYTKVTNPAQVAKEFILMLNK